ncbi:putative ribonuclease H-like domain-containing protein [Tanacetum coccineum]
MGNPQQALKNKGIFDSGCSRHMTGNKDFLINYQDIDGGFVAFSGSARGGKIRTDNVLFTETKCLVLSPDFKLLDNMYTFDLKNVVPSGDLTCLFAKTTIDESNLWHRRLGHVNFETMNKLVKGNLVRGLPLKIFENDHTCVACQKGKQHKASCLAGCDNGTEFKNMEMNEFYGLKGINGEFSVSRTPQLNRVAERNNKTLIEATRTMLADSLLRKFDGKAEEGFLVGYSVNSKAFRVFNSQTRKVEENLHVNFLENKPNVAGQGPNWLFDIDSLTNSMNYQPVTAGNQTNKNAGPQEANGNTGLKQSVDAGQSEEKNVSTQQYIVFPLWSSISSSYKSSDENDTADDSAGEPPVQKPASENEQALKNVLDKMMDQEKEASEQSDAVRKEFEAQCNRELLQGKATKASSTNSFNTVSTPVYAASAPRTSNDAGPSSVSLGRSFPLNVNDLLDDPLMPDLEDTVEVQNTGIFGSAFDDEDLDTYNSPFADLVMGAEADFNNMEPLTVVRTHKDNSSPDDEKLGEAIKEEPASVSRSEVWTLVDLPYGKKAIGTKWVYRNKKDERGIVVRNKARLVAQGYKQEEGIDYIRSLLLLPRIEASVKQKEDGIFISQDKYVGEILKKFGFSSIRTTSTPMETKKALTKHKDGEDVDIHLYSDYAGASLDRKSTIRGCQFLGSRLISWQCKKQTVVANSTTEAKYIDASHCYGQLLWIQNQMLDYGYNFMQTKIHVDNESAICVVKNLVYHSKIKHIEIRHLFIRDSYEKKLIVMVKIHTDYNVIDLLTKAFDVTRYRGLYINEIQIISLTGFPAQSVGSSNTDVLDSPCLLVLITGMSQSREHGIAVVWVLIMLSLSCAETKLASVVIALSTMSPPPYGQPHLLQGLELEMGVVA